MADTARLNTGRSSEFADSAGGSNSPSHEIVSVVKTDSNFSSLNPVTGTTINFTTGRAGISLFTFAGYVSGVSSIPSDSLGINVDGTTYTLAASATVNGSGSDRDLANALSGSIGLSLAAGAHTAYLVIGQSGLGFNASAGSPLTLTIIYPTLSGDVAPASPLTKQDVGPLASDIAGGSGPTLVSGSTISVTLSAPQVVLISIYGTFNDPGNNRCNGQLLARVTVPGPTTTDYPGTLSNGGNDVNQAASTLTRAVQLPAGTSTISVLHDDNGVHSVLSDGYMTVVYTVPQAIAPLPFSLYQTAVRTAGDVTVNTGGSFTDITGPLEVTVVTTGGDVLIEVQASGFTANASSPNQLGLGLKVDTVEQSNSPGITPIGSGTGTTSNYGFLGYKWLATGLSAGSHTFRLTAISTGGSGGTVYATANRPLRMLVWYN